MTTNELKQLAAKIDRIRGLEIKVRRINEMACNQELTPKQEEARFKMEEEFNDIAKSLGLVPEHQRDPRGSSLKLHDKGANIQTETGVIL